MTPRPEPSSPAGWAYRTAKDFGFATVVAAWLLWQSYTTQREDAKERRELLVNLTRAIESNTTSLQDFARDQRDLADVVRTTWPAIRGPRLGRAGSAKGGDTP
jgi:hypothetical protein